MDGFRYDKMLLTKVTTAVIHIFRKENHFGKDSAEFWQEKIDYENQKMSDFWRLLSHDFAKYEKH